MGSKAPSAPDYSGAAAADATASQNIAMRQTEANRPDQYTPFGQSKWQSREATNEDGSLKLDTEGKPLTEWQQDISLSDNQQKAFDYQEQQQIGRNQLGAGLTGQAAYEMGTPMDRTQLPQAANTPDVPTYGNNLPQMGSLPDPNQLGGGVEGQPTYDGLHQWAGTPQNTLDTNALPARGTNPDAAMGDLGAKGQTVAPEQLQRDLSNEGMQNVDAGGGYQDRFAETEYDRNMSLQGPQMEQATEALDVQLRNQGLRPGSEAYDRSMKDLRDQQGERMGRMSQDAIMAGANEQQRQFGRETDLRGQQFGERGQMGDFYNQAGQQGFNQQMAGQQFQEALRGNRAGEVGQQFGQAMQSSQNQDQQRAAGMGEQSRQFDQGMGQQVQQNAMRGQHFEEMERLNAAQGGAADSAYNRQMQTAQYQDQQRNQLMNEQLALGGQGFDQRMGAANYQNQLRQQALSEDDQRRFGSLNAMNALQSGQQVGMPGMPDFSQAQQGRAVNNYGQAAQNQGSFDAQNYGTTMGFYGDALSAAGGASPSDARLKNNIKKIGAYGPLDVVSWTWNGLLGLAGNSMGFIAQQVQEFYPEHVVTMANGYLAINYDALLKEV